jgi:putative membrane protein
MHIGKSYKLWEFLIWTRGTMISALVVSAVSVVLYQLGFKWLSIPWTIVALLGTATAFIIGFMNQQTYSRTWEARQIWGAVVSRSRGWGIMCRDFISDKDHSKELIYRHFAWLTALRYQLRTERGWETMGRSYNKRYKTFYKVPEHEVPLEEELAKYITKDELNYILTTKNRAGQLLSLQSKRLRAFHEGGEIDVFEFMNMHEVIRDFFAHQGQSERIKNFPYPSQYASVNRFFVKLFSFLLPFGLLGEFDQLNREVTGFMQGNMIWLVIPFSILISWVYASLEQVGESTSNPFEGSPNDVPISHMSLMAEIDMREMLGETDLPSPTAPKIDIVL